MTVRENIKAGKYNNKISSDPRFRDDKWMEEYTRILMLLKSDLELEYGLVGHPKADLLWDKASRYERYGLCTILIWYEYLAELLESSVA